MIESENPCWGEINFPGIIFPGNKFPGIIFPGNKFPTSIFLGNKFVKGLRLIVPGQHKSVLDPRQAKNWDINTNIVPGNSTREL